MRARSPRYVRLVRLSPPALAPPHATAAMRRFKLVTFLAGTSKPAPGLEWATAGHGPPGKPTYPLAGIRAALPPPAHMSTCRPCQCAWLCSQMANPGVFHMPGYQPPPGVRCSLWGISHSHLFLSKLTAQTSSISKRTPKPGSGCIWPPPGGTGFGCSF